MNGPARAAFIGALVGAFATLPGLGSGTLWDNSETAYGEVAREIVLRHDWIVMHLNGIPWFVQPPLYFWIAALFAHALGVTAFALRLPSALATVAMGAAVAYAVARRAGTRAGVIASVILSTALMQAIIGRLAIMDALLDLAVTVAIFAWFEALRTGEGRYYLYGAIAAALGFLAKGPVALAVAFLVILPYAFWPRRLSDVGTFPSLDRLLPEDLVAHRSQRYGVAPSSRLVSEQNSAPNPKTAHVGQPPRGYVRPPSALAWVASVAVFVAIVAPWFADVALRTGASHIVTLVGHYTFGRYVGVIEDQTGPVWYYVPVLVLGFFPWIAFLPPAIAYGIKRLEIEPLWRLGLVWIVVPLLFFSFAQTKLPNYVALELPGLALVTALYFDAAARKGTTRSAIVAAGVVPVTIGMLAIAIRIFTLQNRLTGDVAPAVTPLLAAAVAIFVGSTVTAVLVARRSTIGVAPYALGVAMLAAIDVLAIAVLPQTNAFKPIPTLAAIVDRRRLPGDVVGIQDVSGTNSLVFYTRPRVFRLASPGDAGLKDASSPRRVICTAPRAWIVVPRARPAFDPTYGRTRRLVATAAKAALFLYSGPPCTATSQPPSR
ncbi:MAG: glycosyltransferase family 39 protein [Candidatus Tyrphobacter sp.]